MLNNSKQHKGICIVKNGRRQLFVKCKDCDKLIRSGKKTGYCFVCYRKNDNKWTRNLEEKRKKSPHCIVCEKKLKRNWKTMMCRICVESTRVKSLQNNPKMSIASFNRWSNAKLQNKSYYKAGQSPLVGKPSLFKGKKHSLESKIQMSKSRRKLEVFDCFAYDSKERKELIKIRGCYSYKQWRIKILSRDLYTCQVCGTKEGKIQIDHYPKEFRTIIAENNINTLEEAMTCSELWDINNGRAICYNCHIKKHPWVVKAYLKQITKTNQLITCL
jgi:hypothetical protein